jgi:hypothetical protein
VLLRGKEKMQGDKEMLQRRVLLPQVKMSEKEVLEAEAMQ